MDNTQNVIDEEIIKLRKKGYTYKQMVEEFAKKDIKITITTLSIRAKKLLEDTNKITDEEIITLRRKGYTYQQMSDEFAKQGKKISITTLSTRMKKIPEDTSKITDNELIKLRENGYTYYQIVEKFSNEGKKVSYHTILNRFKKIFKDNEEKTLKACYFDENDEEILRLRVEENLSYQEITNLMSNDENNLSYGKIRYRCERICDKNGIIQTKKTKRITPIDDEVLRLKDQEGKTFKEIGTMLSDNKNRSKQEIYRRYIKAKETYNQKIAKTILNLMKTRNATLEQIQIIAEYYGVNLEESINTLEER